MNMDTHSFLVNLLTQKLYLLIKFQTTKKNITLKKSDT